MTTYAGRQSLPHTVYRVYDQDGVLLYIGCTYDLPKRMREHAKSSRWHSRMASVTTEEFPNLHSARRAEYLAIVNEAPQHNVTGAWSRTQQPEPLPVLGTSDGLAYAAHIVAALT